jgi:sugar transferase (PEP-CTERM/EpsH1 system associated)
MRILMLTPILPYPLHQGGAIRNFGILRGLSEAGHEVALLSFHDDSISVESTPLPRLCTEIRTVPPPHRTGAARLRDLILSRQPDLVRRLYSPAFEDCLRSLLNHVQFDLIQFEGLEMAAYLDLVRRQQPTARLCYDAHNAEYRLQQAIFQVDRREIRRWPAAVYSYIQSRRIARFEAEVCEKVDCVIAVSDEDAIALRNLSQDAPASVVPNGVSVDDYTNSREQLDLGQHVLVFTGKMDYRPNIDAMRWFTSVILPAIQEEIPDTRLYIVGQKPHARVEMLRDKPNVAITGWVTDVRPYLHAAHVYVAPLRMGSGTRLKILEAMAAGCAVVATSYAASGLTAEVRDVMVVADDEKAMATAIVALLRAPQKREALGKAAQKYVKQRYDWTVLLPKLLAVYREIGLG